MIEAILGVLILGILIFLVTKAIGNIFKGLLLIFLAFLIYYLFSSSLQSLTPIFQPIGSFLKAPIDKIKSVFFNLEIVAVTQSKEGLVIVVRNTGILPLSNFNVKVDGKDAKIVSTIGILLPRQAGVIEVEWEEGFHKIEVSTREAKAIYIPPL